VKRLAWGELPWGWLDLSGELVEEFEKLVLLWDCCGGGTKMSSRVRICSLPTPPLTRPIASSRVFEVPNERSDVVEEACLGEVPSCFER